MPQTLQQLSLPDNPVLPSLSFLPRAASSRVPVYEPTPRMSSLLPSKLCSLNSLGFRRCQIRTFPKNFFDQHTAAVVQNIQPHADQLPGTHNRSESVRFDCLIF